MMMLMSQMKDSRDIHSERPGPHLEWLMMYQGNRPSNRGQPRECKEFSVIPTADIATLYRVPWTLQPVWQACCQCVVYMYLPVQSGTMAYVR